MNELKIIGRSKNLYEEDFEKLEQELSEIVQRSRFLVVGAAGTIGQSITKEIFRRRIYNF